MSRRNSRAGKARRRAERQELQDWAGQATALADRRSRVLEVQLSRVHFPDDDLGEKYTGWSAEWGLRDDPVGIEDSNEDLQQLVNGIIEDARHWTDRYDLTIEWDLSGDAPAGKIVQDMAAEAGVNLPATVNE
jgi:hypothetical protein